MEISEDALFATIGRLHVQNQVLRAQVQTVVTENRRLTQQVQECRDTEAWLAGQDEPGDTPA